MSHSPFLFLYTNARSIKHKITELKSLVSMYKPHALALTETWLSEQYSDAYIGLSEYNIIRRDRTAHGGGVLLAIKNRFSYSIIEICSNVELICVDVIAQT